MKLNLALMTALILAFYGSLVSCSDTCNPDIDAFEYIKITKMKIIKYSTFKVPQRCVFFNRTKIDDVTKTATYVVTLRYAETGTTPVTETQIDKVTNCSNQVEVLNQGGEVMFDTYLLYGDATCGIFNKLLPEKGCSMFVPPHATEQNVQDCLKRFKEMCGSSKYDVYPSSCYGTAEGH